MTGSKYIMLLDIENVCWNIPIKEEDKDKTGFMIPFGSFMYKKNGIWSSWHSCYIFQGDDAV
jgi:hypothetical protein